MAKSKRGFRRESEHSVELNTRETATVLASLRLFEEHDRFSMIRRFPHFADVSPLDAGEIDALCERINIDGRAVSEYCPICDEPIYVGDRVSKLSDGTLTHPSCKLKKGVRR